MSDHLRVSNPEATVTLYHGTTLDHARRIVAEGLRAPEPAAVLQLLAELERTHGVPAGTAQNIHYTPFDLRRVGEGEVCLSTGWRHAADYARNGPEFLYLGLCVIGESLAAENGVTWANQQLAHTPAVVTIRAPPGRDRRPGTC